MKNYSSKNTAHTPSTNSASGNGTAAKSAFHYPTPNDVADTLHMLEHDCIEAIQGIIRHPRSLARPTSTWRPPLKKLPAVDIDGLEPVGLNLTVARHRVGARAQARVLGFGEHRVPSYLITVRITDPAGQPVPPELAEGWVRALVPEHLVSAVHEITSSSASTFVWLVDSSYVPVHSPVSLFADYSQAA
ncbi:hypothetical protein [Corynebacterium sp.]|uniref:hypothetical protein n=1 Tax=Corynebacterium sp. TaxID=1720 RepID=UPI0026DA85DD|nr:hypothetical protein [Corynebacterium sp.]MDO5032006.1 hypothetical protein [Corynebacterium sp.]